MYISVTHFCRSARAEASASDYALLKQDFNVDPRNDASTLGCSPLHDDSQKLQVAY